MLRRSRVYLALVLLALGGLLAGCAGRPVLNDPSGVAFVDRFLAFLANPNVAYVLLVFGVLALVAEFSAPGVSVPGVIGVILLVLSLYGLLQLPTNWLGPVLIITGIVMLLVDIKVTGIALSVGGIAVFLLGSLLMFTPPWTALPSATASATAPVAHLNPFLMLGTTAVVGLFFLLGVTAALRAQSLPVAVGRETLIDQTGIVRQLINPTGIILIEGEEWIAETATGEVFPVGTVVRVVEVNGLRLLVEWAADAAVAAN